MKASSVPSAYFVPLTFVVAAQLFKGDLYTIRLGNRVVVKRIMGISNRLDNFAHFRLHYIRIFVLMLILSLSFLVLNRDS